MSYDQCPNTSALASAYALFNNRWRTAPSDPAPYQGGTESESFVSIQSRPVTPDQGGLMESKTILVHYRFLRYHNNTFPVVAQYRRDAGSPLLNEIYLTYDEFLGQQVITCCIDLLHDDEAPSAAHRVVAGALWTLSMQWSLGTNGVGFTILNEHNWAEVMGKLCEGTLNGFIEARLSEEDYEAFKRAMVYGEGVEQSEEEEFTEDDGESETEGETEVEDDDNADPPVILEPYGYEDEEEF
ncbi:hypothetical protein ACHAQA_000637 [Verticillium albo-atrum]